MINSNVSRTIETKKGNKWFYGSTCRDAALVYESLANDLIAKKSINALISSQFAAGKTTTEPQP